MDEKENKVTNGENGQNRNGRPAPHYNNKNRRPYGNKYGQKNNQRPDQQKDQNAPQKTAAAGAETASENKENIPGAPQTENVPETSDDGSVWVSSAELAPAEEKIEVVGVHFKKSSKVYYFAPGALKLEKDARVIVETARGLEYGIVAAENREVNSRDIVQPLKNVIRKATEEDEKHLAVNENKEIEAFNTCLTKIEEHRLEMKLVDVEYTFDNSKLIFYFTADGRVDFRELVKDLANVFRTRIELHQIGIRDEAKMIGGLGICGRPFCCKAFLPDFVQVSIKMAKCQNLSLNSAKISGTCGRLMCCLRYEYDTYSEEIAKTPKVDSIVITPDGEGVVTEVTPLAGMVKVALTKSPDQPVIYHRDDLKVKVPGKKVTEDEKDDDTDVVPDEDEK